MSLFALCLAIASVAPAAHAALPYVSTSLFLSNINGADLVFAFSPGTSSQTSFQLQRLNVSGKLDAGISPWTTLSATLPFLSPQSPSFVPIADRQGDLWAYAGNCSAGWSGSALWTYSPDKEGSTDVVWQKAGLGVGRSSSSPVLDGANYLSAGIAFSSVVNDTSKKQKLYAFGGMCPSLGTEASTWTNLANYSNSMISLSPSTTVGVNNYQVNVVQSKGPPIAEAGFSITPLEPSFMNKANGRQTQQQNFVLLGGHTQTAFINTSQVALFSLPEEGWTFVNVKSDASHPDLTVREEQIEVEPRSGHTSVLSADGKSIIVFGGWVGEINTPAQPQLAVLNIGDGYGGNGAWSWSIPKQVGPGLPSGQGIYGHSAVTLPGGVMMVTGGFLTPAGPGSRRRDNMPSATRRTMFLNTTSNTWISTYTNPASLISSSNEQSSGFSSSSRKAAIGSGVGLGLAALIGSLLVCLWYSKKLRKRREGRERDLRALAIGASHFHNGSSHHSIPPSMASRGGTILGRTTDRSRVDSSSSSSAQSATAYPWADPALGQDAERTGLLVDVPSPTRGLRRSLHSRGKLPAPSTSDRGMGLYEGLDPQNGRRGISGIIHPIDEQDEYDPPFGPETSKASTKRPISDPFLDPVPQPLRSHPLYEDPFSITPPPPPAHAAEHEKNAAIRSWVDSWAAAREPPGRHDSASPEKDRTSSSLSEKSNRSHQTTSSVSGPSGGILSATGTISRTLSQRSAAFLSGMLSNPFATSTAATTSSPAPGDILPIRATTQDRRPTQMASQSRVEWQPRPESGGSSSFTTAETSFSTLQAEGASLLPQLAESEREPLSEPGSPSKSKPRTSTSGWMGTVKKAFRTGGTTTTSRSPSPQSSTSSPLKAYASPAQDYNESRSGYGESGLKPRRAISLTSPQARLQRSPSSSGPGADLAWRQRKGARDWAQSHRDTGELGQRASLARTQSGRTAASSEEGDWDIEAAVEQRVVQVLFTVPRERLRVVNAETDVEEDGTSEQAEVVGGSTDHLAHDGAAEEQEEENSEEKLPVMARRRDTGERMLVD